MPTVLITGCSSGIGLYAARHLQSRGWTVFATCRTEAETWYRDLAALQVALAWARYDAATPPGRPRR